MLVDILFGFLKALVIALILIVGLGPPAMMLWEKHREKMAAAKARENMKFQSGDYVRVRDWDDLESEYGLDDDGDIKVANPNSDEYIYFLRAMQHLCGHVYRVNDPQLLDGCDVDVDSDVDPDAPIDIYDYCITSTMFEPYVIDADIELDVVGIDEILF